jgi:hypothetical protein
LQLSKAAAQVICFQIASQTEVIAVRLHVGIPSHVPAAENDLHLTNTGLEISRTTRKLIDGNSNTLQYIDFR